MATIIISITESPLQLLAGIPSTVTLSTNLPATIFYTLDGTEPTTDSLVAVDRITMPTDSSVVILQAFATDGIDFSPIISQEYKTSVVGLRKAYDKAYVSNNTGATYPFGNLSDGNGSCVTFGNSTGIIVDNQTNPNRQPDGYDGTATGTGAGYFIPPKSQYEVLFSETDSIGQTGKGIGTLPGRVLWVKARNDNSVTEHSNAQKALFNPRALVIFQDSREEPYDPSIPRINRPYFDLEDPGKVRDGSLLSVSETVSPSGSFLKSHYNPTHNTMTYYYYDNRTCRWIISTEPFNQNQNPTSNLSGIVTRSSRGQGIGMIYKWIPFQYHRLI